MGRMPWGLADLECTSETLNDWSPLRHEAIAVVDLWRAGVLQKPPRELEELARDLINPENAELYYSHFWADRDDPDPWPFQHYCILGHVTAFYLLAWAASSEGNVVEAEDYLVRSVSMLRMNDYDFFEHTSWPFTSFDILSNLFFIRRGWAFQGKHLKPTDPGEWVRPRLPVMWPPYSPQCWPICPNEVSPAKLQLKVWWASKNPGPFVDFATVLENWMSDRYDVQVSHNALADHCEYARYKDWLCSKDTRLKEVLQEKRILSQMSQAACGERGQWCGLRGLNEEFEEVLPRFRAVFTELTEVDLFACGHPLYWCRLVAGFGAPVLGIWDMAYHFTVPEHLQEAWTAEFLDLFGKRGNLLVAMSAYHSFQVRWLLGLKVPYFQPVTSDVSLGARYSPHARPDEVLVSRRHTPYELELLYRFAEESKLPFRFVAWEDLPCGQDCAKADLGSFRASVLSAYDTSPMKLTEFYAMSIPTCIWGGPWDSFYFPLLGLFKRIIFSPGP